MPLSNDVVKHTISGLCGVVFGIAAEKGRVHHPTVIRGQMDFSTFTMMKMFLGASAAGMISISLLSMLSNSTRMKVDEARSRFLSGLKGKGLVCSLLGGGLLGAGMTVAGTCPGMVYVQVGSQLHNALFSLAGGFLGAFAYSVLHPTVSALTGSTLYSGKQIAGSRDYISTALPLAAVLVCSVFALEQLQPSNHSWGTNILATPSWPPYIAGAVIGLLQVPLVLFVRDTLSTSTSYFTALSQGLITPRLRRAFPHLAGYRDASWWQMLFVGGAILGGFLSAQASGSLTSNSPVSQSQALMGGAMMVFGSRLAGGCTSGQGLSGIPLLIGDSFVTVAAMFAGAMATHALLF